MSSSDDALLLDLYELTMASSYLRHGMTAEATFDLFVRRLPDHRNFLVACGIERALQYLESLHFDDTAIERVRSLGIFDASFLDALRSFRFTGEVWAVPEGELVLDGEPILRVTAPIAEAQLVETFLLNAVLFETMIATKAARVYLAAEGRPFVEFGMRRAHGSDAALRGARAAFVGGAAGSSNVLAATTLGFPASGTMAHSFVMAFDHEYDAFDTYARDHGERTILLIDTWDTIEGARRAVQVGQEMAKRGHRIHGVRIDSGDFDRDSRTVRALLDDAGLNDAQIFASGDLDEHSIADLVKKGAPIDSFGVGTQLAASADAPALGGVYKLAEYAGVPRMKLSKNKVTLPGRKQVHRIESGGVWTRDVISLQDESVPGGLPLLQRVMAGGRRLSPPEPLAVVRARCLERLAGLPAPLRQLDVKVKQPVELGPKLQKLLEDTTSQLRAESASR